MDLPLSSMPCASKQKITREQNVCWVCLDDDELKSIGKAEEGECRFCGRYGFVNAQRTRRSKSLVTLVL
eukprot:955395-Pelagomonas_calceolata.AAC.1